MEDVLFLCVNVYVQVFYFFKFQTFSLGIKKSWKEIGLGKS